MTFEEVLDQAMAMLQRRGRVTYRTLQRQFQLDDAALEDLKDALLYAHPQLRDDAGRGLIWTGDPSPAPPTAAALTATSEQTPLAYTPPYLAEKILTSRSSLEGERKQVTVLFADLKGSMELLADRDPEEARAILDPVLEHMMAAVHRYEGTVNQVMGDGIMALFGAPLAHEDDAVRACYAALAMQEAIGRYAEELRRQQGLDVQIRVGLNSGEVVVRAIGNDLHMDYTAVGQTTHLAARMEQLARPGTALLTVDTLRLVEGYIEVTPLGPVPVKGLPEPIDVYELRGAGPVRSRLQAAAARGLTRFVGRDTELDVLHQAFARAGDGQGQVVAVIGEPGVGKSRLVYECLHSHYIQGWKVLESASVSYGKATPYFPVIDLLRRYAHLDERDDPRTVRANVTGQLLTLDETLQEAIPPLLALLDALPDDSPFLALDPPQRRQRTLTALKRVLLRESQVQPVLLVCEDLHWIDSETQALLDSLIESLPTARLLLLVNYRPEYQHGWGSKTYYTQLRLDPLPPASADAFLQALLGDDPSLDALKRLLIARTEGNPFFLEESVHTLVETWVLVGECGAYRLAQTLPGIQVPATVQAVLAARIDRLPPEEKRLLQTAAVIGTEVPFPLLQAIAELPEATLHRSLAHLQAAEFLYETRLFPEREYTFKHALTHEVAYGGLLLERRHALHAGIVDAMETLYPDRLAEQVERLAQHAFRGEVWAKALAYCRQAGVKALMRSAYQEALACFEQALHAVHQLPENRDTLEQAIDLRFDLRQALRQLGESERIVTILHEAETLARALDDPRRLGRSAAYLCNYLRSAGDYEGAIEAGRRAQALATTYGDVPLQVLTNEYLGFAYSVLGDYRQAIDCLQWNLASIPGDRLREYFGLPGLAFVLSWGRLARCCAECGAFAEGHARGEEAIQLAEAVGHAFTSAFAYSNLGFLYLWQGAILTAIPVLERGREICQTANLRLVFTNIAGLLGQAYALAGRCAEALPLLERAVEEIVAMGLAQMPAYAPGLVRLSEGYLLAGRLEDAIPLAQRALEHACAHKERGHQAYALRLLGEIAAHHHPPVAEEAEGHYRQALALAEELGMRPLIAHCHLGLGTLYTKLGRPEQARIELSTAIEMYRTMEMTSWLPQAEAALAGAEG